MDEAIERKEKKTFVKPIISKIEVLGGTKANARESDAFTAGTLS